MSRKAYWSVLAVFLILFPKVSITWAEEISYPPANARVVKAISVNLIEGLKEQKILILEAEPGNVAQTLLLTVGDGVGASIVVESNAAPPLIKNTYSPAGYDGFDVGVSLATKSTISVVDVQGETVSLKYPTIKPVEYLYLRTVEEGNGRYNFNLHFKYDAQTRKMVLERLLLLTNNELCDQSLLSVYSFPVVSLGLTSLDDFNGAAAFEHLKKLHIESQRDSGGGEKIMPIDVSIDFDQALEAYKKNDKEKFKQLMSHFIMHGIQDSTCAPGNYIVDKYYFPKKPRWSNDLGFLFEESGRYEEAVELLSHVIADNPDRVVAYLNLADSYWGLGNKKMAIENYKKYNHFMVQSGKTTKIPKRVSERSDMSSRI